MNLIKVTPEEIAQFRSQLKDYTNLKVIEALSVIEIECEGYLEDAVALLLMRETDIEADKSISDLLLKCRKIICQEEIREALETGFLVPAIEPVAIGAGVPPGVATAICICVFKY